ncbi:MAG: helix-turn-helix transcriptional regulator, partial [Actinomycetales bacterium]|nr:helix-turn-helix transcriptional regulator [Actinomycetales bacterium]
MLINPITLTVGERLEISRRRAGLTQKEAAALLGWPFKSYLRAEHGKDDEAAAPHIVSLAPGEECRVYRKR